MCPVANVSPVKWHGGLVATGCPRLGRDFPNIGLSHWFVRIPFVCQTAITCESVGYNRTARLNMLLNEILDIRARPALKRLHSHSPTSFLLIMGVIRNPKPLFINLDGSTVDSG